MTPKFFWTYSLKIFGLYAIWQSILILPQFFSITYLSVENKTVFLVQILILLIYLVLYAALGYYCVYKTKLVIDKLKLENGFNDEVININIHRSSLLKIAIIIVGGIMLADSLPLLTSNLFQYFQNSAYSSKFKDNRYSPLVILYMLKVVIGYFMVADNRLIVNFIERKRKINQ